MSTPDGVENAPGAAASSPGDALADGISSMTVSGTPRPAQRTSYVPPHARAGTGTNPAAAPFQQRYVPLICSEPLLIPALQQPWFQYFRRPRPAARLWSAPWFWRGLRWT